MHDLIRGSVFVACQLLLLGVVFALVPSRNPAGSAAGTRTPGKAFPVREYLFVVAAAVTLMAAAVHIGKLAYSGNQPAGTAAALTLTQEAMRGMPVSIRLDPEACLLFNLGSIECGSDYQGKYEAPLNRWTITGMEHTHHTVMTFTDNHAAPIPGSLSLWGMLSRFDDDGVIFYFGEAIGTIRLAAPLSPASAPKQ